MQPTNEKKVVPGRREKTGKGHVDGNVSVLERTGFAFLSLYIFFPCFFLLLLMVPARIFVENALALVS